MSQSSSVINQIAKSLEPGQSSILRDLFNAEGARAPEVIWAPTDADLRSPLLRKFSAVVAGYRNSDGQVPASSLRLEDFGGLTEWLMLVDVMDGGSDYQYTFYGPSIAEYYGQDMTGRRTSEFQGHIASFFAGLYAAVRSRREPVYSEHEPPAQVFVRVWQRLIVPLVDPQGQVVRILVLNVPDNELRTGLELLVDPVFVLSGNQNIIYANRAAQTLFGLKSVRNSAETLEDVTGIALETALSPDDMLSQHRVEDSVQLTIREAIVERLVMTVSATQHRGLAFYVVVMRLIGT